MPCAADGHPAPIFIPIPLRVSKHFAPDTLTCAPSLLQARNTATTVQVELRARIYHAAAKFLPEAEELAVALAEKEAVARP